MTASNAITMDNLHTLLHTVSGQNTVEDLRNFFFDPVTNTALAGYRRFYEVGDCLVRIRCEQVDMGMLQRSSTTFNYAENRFFNSPGLPGMLLPEGGRELVTPETASHLFNSVYSQVAEPVDKRRVFSILLNPKTICDFLETRLEYVKFEDHKINIQVVDGVSQVLEGSRFEICFPAKVVPLPDGTPAFATQGPQGLIPAFVDEERTNISASRLKDGKLYLVQISPNRAEGRRHLRVLREYVPGIRMALQRFPNGLRQLDGPSYSVDESVIPPANILDLPFIQGQARGKALERAPIMTFDAETLYRALKPMDSFKVVEMMFRDSITGTLIRSLGGPVHGMEMDAIIGPTSPYKYGKVYTL